MHPLPPLDQDTVIELAREGGFAFIPKLAAPRRIAFIDIPPEQRQRVYLLLEQAEPYAQEEGQAGCGDQRYFRIQISFSNQHSYSEMVWLIPETEAPPALVELWKKGVD
jgi:hypothetical protein